MLTIFSAMISDALARRACGAVAGQRAAGAPVSLPRALLTPLPDAETGVHTDVDTELEMLICSVILRFGCL